MSKLTSLVWLCTTTGNNSKVQVINAGNPAQVLESFQVPDAHILTIASIPGKQQLYLVNLFEEKYLLKCLSHIVSHAIF